MKTNIHYFDKGRGDHEGPGVGTHRHPRPARDGARRPQAAHPAGFVIDADVASRLGDYKVMEALAPWLARLAKRTGKTFGDPPIPCW